VECIAGTTLKATWVNSGVTPSSLQSLLLDSSDSLISSFNALTLGSSGNGFYYGVHSLPNTQAWYVNQWISLIQANTYSHRQLVRVHRLEV
jgi:hypothetical protein